MNRLQQILVRFRSWRDNRQSAALLSDIEYHKRAECWHRTAAWRLTQEWREQQKKTTLSPYAREIQWICDERDLKEAEQTRHKVREVLTEARAEYKKFSNPCIGEIVYMDRVRRYLKHGD